MDKADRYGFCERADATGLLELLADYGQDFDEESWVKYYLELRVVEPAHRLHLINDKLMADNLTGLS
jgi:hypothetical protein